MKGSTACKSPCCSYHKCYFYYYDSLKSSELFQGSGAESGSTGSEGKRGHIEIFTYSQTDFLELSAAVDVDVRSTPSCAEGRTPVR